MCGHFFRMKCDATKNSIKPKKQKTNIKKHVPSKLNRLLPAWRSANPLKESSLHNYDRTLDSTWGNNYSNVRLK